MFVERRRQLILRRLARDGSVRVADLSREWGINPMTVRRDLSALEDQRLLRRVYGGALPLNPAESGGPRIGLMVPHTEYYYGLVVSGAERAAQHLGARLVLATHFYDIDLEHERLAKLTSLQLDGLVIATSGAVSATIGTEPGEPDDGTISDHVDDGFVRSVLDRLDFPVVVLERGCPQRLVGADPCVVRSAHDRGAVTALHHFHRLGHERVLALLDQTPTALGIRTGLLDGASRLGMQVSVVSAVRRVFDLAAAAARCRDESIRAVLAHPDTVGLQLLPELARLGLRVPDDVHLISYDDEAADTGPVPLTAISPAKEELGYEAVRLALHRIDSGSAQAVQHVTLSPRLVERASTPALPSAP